MYSNNKNINARFKLYLLHDVLIFKVSFERPCLLLCNLKGNLKEFYNGRSGHECNTLHVNVSTFYYVLTLNTCAHVHVHKTPTEK